MDERPEDGGEFDALDDYLDRLHAGQSVDRAALLEEHPSLASALDCLEALDRLAPSPGAAATAETTVEGESVTGLPCDFGPYELLAEVGRGGMGVVYRARQKSLDRTVAIKMILAGRLASPEHV